MHLHCSSFNAFHELALDVIICICRGVPVVCLPIAIGNKEILHFFDKTSEFTMKKDWLRLWLKHSGSLHRNNLHSFVVRPFYSHFTLLLKVVYP